MSGQLTSPGPTPSAVSPPGAVGAGTQPGQPPFGSSPVQMPTPNRGLQAAALTQVSWAVRILEKALPVLGATSPVGKDIMGAIKSLAKHTPQEQMSTGVENNTLQQMMMGAKAEQPQTQLLKALQQGQSPAGGMPAQPQQGAA